MADARQGDDGGRRLRLLLVADALDVNGAQRHMVELGLALAARGHDVTLACTADGLLGDRARAGGLRVRVVLDRVVRRRVSLRFAWRLAALQDATRFDLVHAHMYASATACSLATLAAGVPLVVTEHSGDQWKRGRDRAVTRVLYRRAGAVIAVSPGIGRRLIDVDGMAPQRVTVIENAYWPQPAPRQCWPLPQKRAARDAPLVAVAARLVWEKGVQLIPEIAERVLAQVQGAEFVVLGGGPLEEELRAAIGVRGFADQVHLLGVRSDAQAVIAAADVLLLPSLTVEGTPLVVLEAMAAGVPVVATTVGGIPQQVRHGREGLLVPPGDPSSLAAALVRLLRDPPTRRRMGEAGRRRIAERYSAEAMVDATEAAYRRLLPAHSTTGWDQGEVPQQPAAVPATPDQQSSAPELSA